MHSLILAVILVFTSLNVVYGAPTITYNDPAQDNQIVSNNWINVSINSSEALNYSILEWGWNNGSLSNFSMINDSVGNQTWSYNVSGLSAGRHNYTIWALNTTGDWNPDSMRFVIVSAISACQNITVGNVNYILIQNVNSSETCFKILANDVTIDGAGFMINYSQSTEGYGIKNIGGYDNITIKNLSIVQGSAITASHAIYSSGMGTGNITNNTITTSGSFSYGIFLSSSSSNTLSNNTILTSGLSGLGIFLDSSSNSNTLLNNAISTSGASGVGIEIQLSNSNILSNNTIVTSNETAYGIYIISSTSNSITGGSIIATKRDAYYLGNASTTNDFTNTNFTALRNITFADSTSWFNYNNETSGSIWLKTNVSELTTLSRTLTTWSNVTMQWNDTNSTEGITASYVLTGLLPDTIYDIYNTSGVLQNKSYTLTTNSAGVLPSFNISLNGSTAILVDSLPNITINSPSNGSYFNTTTISTLVLNITTNEPSIWCKFSLNGTSNTTMTNNTFNMSWNYSVISVPTEGLNNITFFCNDSRGNIGTSATRYFTKDTITPTITTPTHSTPTSSASTITWNVSEPAVNTVYYRTGTGAYTPLSSPTTDRPSIELTELTSSSLYKYYVVSCDLAGNCNRSIDNVDEFNTASSGSAPADDSGTTGGSTGGGDSGLSKSWASISSGSTAVMSVTSTSVDITDIIFKANQALTKVKISVSKLSTKPSATASTPQGSVYQYLSVTPENITDSKIASATISFRVNSTWISSNLINSSSIVLYRYANGQWNALVTHPTGTSGSYTTYLAETPGFSYFAISGKIKSSSTPAAPPAPVRNTTTNSTKPANNTSITSSTLSSNSTSDNNETISDGEASSSTRTSLIAFIVIIIAVVVVMVFREKLKINLPLKSKITVPKFYAGQKTQTSGSKYTFNSSEVKKAELVYKPQPKEEKVKYTYKNKK